MEAMEALLCAISHAPAQVPANDGWLWFPNRSRN